ncbi:MAG: helix-turn-helix transcriptional regulator, partial [Acidimicrobiales bacterium]|nr:helix-turn-helix transcriptional regulator [Acidimicrobiales bacterium]
MPTSIERSWAEGLVPPPRTIAGQAGARPPAFTGSWPLTGQSQVVDRVVARLRGVGGPAGVGLIGPPGSGRSRLVRECADALARPPAPLPVVLWGARATQDVPLGTLAPVLDPSARDPGYQRSLIGPMRALEARADGGTLLIALDDAHLLDGPSAVVLRRALLGGQVRLLLTLEEGAPLHPDVMALWREDAMEDVVIRPLRRHDVAKVVNHALSGGVDPVLATRLWRLTKGNPLYLCELLRASVEEGSIATEGGVWRLAGEIATSALLDDLVTDRIRVMDHGQRELVALVVEGQVVDLDHLLKLGSAATIAELERDGWIVAHQLDGVIRYRVAHPLFGDVLVRKLSPAQRRRLCCRLAAALEGLDRGTDDDLLLICSWRIRGGEPPDPRQVHRAASVALATTNIALVAQFARHLWQTERTAASALMLADALYPQRSPEAGAEVDEALRWAQDYLALTADERLEVLAARALNRSAPGLNDPDGAAALVREVVAEVAAQGDRRGSERIALTLALLQLGAGYPGDALESLTLISIEPRSITAHARAMCLMFTGRWEELLVLLSRARAGTNAPAEDALATMLLCAYGDPDEAIRVSQRSIERATPAEHRLVAVQAGTMTGRCHLAAGRSAEALLVFKEVAAAFGLMPGRQQAIGYALEAAVMCGQSDEVHQLLAELGVTVGSLAAAPGPAVARGMARYRLAQGAKVDEVAQLFGDAGADFARRRQPLAEMEVLNELTLLGRVDETQAARLTELAAQTPAPLFAAWAAAARASAARDLCAIEAAVDGLLAVGDVRGACAAAQLA